MILIPLNFRQNFIFLFFINYYLLIYHQLVSNSMIQWDFLFIIISFYYKIKDIKCIHIYKNLLVI